MRLMYNFYVPTNEHKLFECLLSIPLTSEQLRSNHL